MKEHISSLLFILDYRKYPEDIVFIAISPYDGQRHIIVKKGNSGNGRRKNIIDTGNVIKAKIFQRHHWYLSEAETVESFSYIKKDLSLIILFQALLSILKIVYVIPEKKIFYSIFRSLKDIETRETKEKQELSMFLLILKVLTLYDLIDFPFCCETCGKKLYDGYFHGLTYTCKDHKKPQGIYFSITDENQRLKFLQTLLRYLFNIPFTYKPVKK